MLVRNKSAYDYYLKNHTMLIPAGSSITVDDSVWTSDDQLARTIETLDHAGYLAVTSPPTGYPRTSGFPSVVNIIGGGSLPFLICGTNNQPPATLPAHGNLFVAPNLFDKDDPAAIWASSANLSGGELPAEFWWQESGDDPNYLELHGETGIYLISHDLQLVIDENHGVNDIAHIFIDSGILACGGNSNNYTPQSLRVTSGESTYVVTIPQLHNYENVDLQISYWELDVIKIANL